MFSFQFNEGKNPQKTMINILELGNSCAKGLLIVLNLLCILVSLCTFGFAIVDINILKQYSEDRSTGSSTGDLVIAIVSMVLVAVAVFGCVAAAKENVKLLYLYVCFILILIIMEMMITIYVSIQRYGLKFRVTEWIREDFFKNVTSFDEQDHLKLWDDLQTTYECCGLNSPEDYIALNKDISVSCCPRAFRARTDYAKKLLYRSCLEAKSYYENGCEDVILDILKSDGNSLLGVALLTFWFEAVDILLAMWMANHLKNSVQVYKHTVKY